jgi:hypothetical protein
VTGPGHRRRDLGHAHEPLSPSSSSLGGLASSFKHVDHVGVPDRGALGVRAVRREPPKINTTRPSSVRPTASPAHYVV